MRQSQIETDQLSTIREEDQKRERGGREGARHGWLSTYPIRFPGDLSPPPPPLPFSIPSISNGTRAHTYLYHEQEERESLIHSMNSITQDDLYRCKCYIQREPHRPTHTKNPPYLFTRMMTTLQTAPFIPGIVFK